ncbi:hypothetical protein [Nocardioides sp. J54]|uniref:hypothetical protein n=1 Tax=Nocardioides sp. J54 TaxID=935866 RepID=UPI0012FA334A|nr:hypothetical protein [Nocardioides sp. J54]
MITRIALDSHSLNHGPGNALDQRLQSQRLAATVRDYGLLSLLGEHDAAELKTVLEQQAVSLGYDFWRPLLRSLADGGQGILTATPASEQSTHDLCQQGDLNRLRAMADLVVVDGRGDRIPGLSPTQVASLYETSGYVDGGGGAGPELALATAADQCSSVQGVKRLRRETVIPKDTSESVLWSTYFSSLGRVSTEVNIFDRYLFSGLIRTDRRRRTDVRYLQWFLNSLDRDLPSRSTVNLFAWTGQKVADTHRDPTARPYSVDDIANAIRGLDRWDRPGRLHLYLWDGLHHDRHLRFSSGHAIMPQQGLDQLQFRQGQLTKNFSYSFVPSGPSLTARADEESRARARGAHWVHKSKKHGFAGAVPSDTNS